MTAKRKKNEIVITSVDHQRLNQLLDNLEATNGEELTEDLADLRRELERAKIAEPRKVPKNVITMNSRFRIRDIDSDEQFDYTLAWPDEAFVEENRLSILAPVGTALLGYRVGDVIEWPVPAGVRHFKVEEILYQPEANNQA